MPVGLGGDVGGGVSVPQCAGAAPAARPRRAREVAARVGVHVPALGMVHAAPVGVGVAGALAQLGVVAPLAAEQVRVALRARRDVRPQRSRAARLGVLVVAELFVVCVLEGRLAVGVVGHPLVDGIRAPGRERDDAAGGIWQQVLDVRAAVTHLPQQRPPRSLAATEPGGNDLPHGRPRAIPLLDDPAAAVQVAPNLIERVAVGHLAPRAAVQRIVDVGPDRGGVAARLDQPVKRVVLECVIRGPVVGQGQIAVLVVGLVAAVGLRRGQIVPEVVEHAVVGAVAVGLVLVVLVEVVGGRAGGRAVADRLRPVRGAVQRPVLLVVGRSGRRAGAIHGALEERGQPVHRIVLVDLALEVRPDRMMPAALVAPVAGAVVVVLKGGEVGVRGVELPQLDDPPHAVVADVDRSGVVQHRRLDGVVARDRVDASHTEVIERGGFGPAGIGVVHHRQAVGGVVGVVDLAAVGVDQPGQQARGTPLVVGVGRGAGGLRADLLPLLHEPAQRVVEEVQRDVVLAVGWTVVVRGLRQAAEAVVGERLLRGPDYPGGAGDVGLR